MKTIFYTFTSVLLLLSFCIFGCRMGGRTQEEPLNFFDDTGTGPSAGGGGENQELTLSEFIKSLGNGWNLGNTLDAKTDGYNTDNLGLSTERSWGLPYTTRKMIDAVSQKGFKTIRIPVSWHNHIMQREGCRIDVKWLERVRQIVDWSLESGLNVIINIHHDNLSEDGLKKNAGFCVSPDFSENSAHKESSMAFIEAVWSQVSSTFRDYDERLVFELLNEPRAVGTAHEWNSSGAALLKMNALIMEYEQRALDVIRSSGGKNAVRYVMVPPYAASPDNMDGWSLPSDSATKKLIVSVHAYTPYEFAMGSSSVNEFSQSHRASIDYLFENLRRNFLQKGIPVVVGEVSATDKKNTAEREKWTQYYFGKARTLSVPLVLWDNMVTASTGGSIDSGECHGYFNRNDCSWFFPDMVDMMLY